MRVQHSMVYFFHHYELPAVEQQAHVHNLIALAQQQQTPQHLLTVMTRTATGDLARTTADISELRPVTLDHATATTDTSELRPVMHDRTTATTDTSELRPITHDHTTTTTDTSELRPVTHDHTTNSTHHVHSPSVSASQIHPDSDNFAVSLEHVARDVNILSVAVPQITNDVAQVQSDVADETRHVVAGPSASHIECKTCDIVGHETNAAVEHADDDCRRLQSLSDNSVLQSAACETVSATGNQLTVCDESDR